MSISKPISKPISHVVQELPSACLKRGEGKNSAAPADDMTDKTKFEHENADVRVHQGLWMLGPMYVNFRAEDLDEEDKRDDDVDRATGTIGICRLFLYPDQSPFGAKPCGKDDDAKPKRFGILESAKLE